MVPERKLHRFGAMVTLVAAAACLVPRPVAAGDCATAIANKKCDVRIDREKPVAPLPVRVTSTAVVTIKVPRRPLEAITFDTALADTAAPDVLGAIFTAFVPGLQAVTFGSRSVAPQLAPPPPPPPGVVRTLADQVEDVLDDMLVEQRSLKAPLDAVETRIDNAGEELATFAATAAGTWHVADLAAFRRHFYCNVQGKDATIDGSMCGVPERGAGTMPLPAGVINGLRVRLKGVLEQFERLSPDDRRALAPKMDHVSNTQRLLEASLESLEKAQVALVAAAATVKAIDPKTAQPIVSHPIGGFAAGTNRTATVEVVAKDLISGEKTKLTSVVIHWGGTSWEVSGGVLFSALHNREFSNSPIVENGVPRLNEKGEQLTEIVETQTRPVVVPFVLTHYRFGEWPVGSQNRVAILFGGGIGVNPYSKSADFALGPSIAFRGLMLSPMLHWTQDQTLTGGLTPGQELGPAPPDLSTQRHWVRKLAIGVTYRIAIN